MSTPRRIPAVLATFVAAAVGMAAAACGTDGDVTTAPTRTPATQTSAGSDPVIDPGDGGAYRPAIDPAGFVTVIDNPYLPLLPGARWVYEEPSEDGPQRIEVTVTEERRDVMGISAVVVRDTVSLDGTLVEDTFDWFAQDVAGNVWYLGEATVEYENGEAASTAGSWEAGVDGALPGIIMLATPAVGDAYRQEYAVGEAEDLAEVVGVGVRTETWLGSYSDVVVIEEWNPFEPDTIEEKYYAPGVGVILEVTTAGGDGRVELIEYVPGRS